MHLYLCACAKYPLRTNSAPPNLDEQKREQVSVLALLFRWYGVGSLGVVPVNNVFVTTVSWCARAC